MGQASARAALANTGSRNRHVQQTVFRVIANRFGFMDTFSTKIDITRKNVCTFLRGDFFRTRSRHLGEHKHMAVILGGGEGEGSTGKQEVPVVKLPTTYQTTPKKILGKNKSQKLIPKGFVFNFYPTHLTCRCLLEHAALSNTKSTFTG